MDNMLFKIIGFFVKFFKSKDVKENQQTITGYKNIGNIQNSGSGQIAGRDVHNNYQMSKQSAGKNDKIWKNLLIKFSNNYINNLLKMVSGSPKCLNKKEIIEKEKEKLEDDFNAINISLSDKNAKIFLEQKEKALEILNQVIQSDNLDVQHVIESWVAIEKKLKNIRSIV